LSAFPWRGQVDNPPPPALLDTATLSHFDRPGWHWPASRYALRRLNARSIGLVTVAMPVMVLVLGAAVRTVTAALLPLA
jgi:hypothetical protein